MATGNRAADHSPVAEAALSPEDLELQQLLQERLSDYEPELGAAMDIPSISVRPGNIVEVCRIVKEDPSFAFKFLLCLAAVDYKEYIQIVYVLLSFDLNAKLLIKVDVPYENPQIATVSPLWRAANWYEREAHDLFGVIFTDHPDMQPLLLYEGFEGYPGRKEHPFHDYQEF